MQCPDYTVAGNQNLDENVTRGGGCVLLFPRERHCILYAFNLGLQEIAINNAIEDLVPKIKREVLDNIDFYLLFVGNIY